MINDKTTDINATEVDPNLLRMLDKGIDDIEEGRTLSNEEAMEEVRRIRDARRNADENI